MVAAESCCDLTGLLFQVKLSKPSFCTHRRETYAVPRPRVMNGISEDKDLVSDVSSVSEEDLQVQGMLFYLQRFRLCCADVSVP